MRGRANTASCSARRRGRLRSDLAGCRGEGVAQSRDDLSHGQVCVAHASSDHPRPARRGCARGRARNSRGTLAGAPTENPSCAASPLTSVPRRHSHRRAGDGCERSPGTDPSIVSCSWCVHSLPASSRGASFSRPPRNSRMFGVCAMTCRPVFRVGTAKGGARRPSLRAISVLRGRRRLSPPARVPRRRTGAPASSSARRMNSPRPWTPGQ